MSSKFIIFAKKTMLEIKDITILLLYLNFFIRFYINKCIIFIFNRVQYFCTFATDCRHKAVIQKGQIIWNTTWYCLECKVCLCN